MTASHRLVALPTGTVPPIREFMRHVWSYRDRDGQTVLTTPPGPMFSLVLDDPDESGAAMTILQILDVIPGYDGRSSFHMDGPNFIIEFRDLHIVHSFLCVLASKSAHAPAREVAAFCMNTLGFHWT